MKYWAYINNEIKGPFEKEKLIELPEFSNSTLICPQSPVGEKTEDWKEAASYPEIAALISGTNPVSPPPSAGGVTHSLKPISISEINQPQTKENISGPTIEVSDLASLSTKKEEAPKEQIIGSEKFDPISISQIGKKAVTTEDTKLASSVDPISLSQISKKQQNFTQSQSSPQEAEQIPTLNLTPDKASTSPVADTPLIKIKEESQKTAEPLSSRADNINTIQLKPLKIAAAETEKQQIVTPPAPAQPAPVTPTQPEIISSMPPQSDNSGEILKLIEKLAANTATKNDINDLKNYIDNKIDDVQRKIANISVSDIDNSLKKIDSRLAAIEGKVNYLEAAKPSASNFTSPLEKIETPLSSSKIGKQEEKKEPSTDKEENKSKSINIAPIIKGIFKGILIIILIVAIGGVTIFALKQAEIIDLTKFIPLPFFSTTLQTQTVEVSQQEVITSTENVVSISTTTLVTEERTKDLSEEVVYFARTYTANEGGLSLENSIIAIGKKKKWKVQAISWQAKMEKNNTYSVNCTIPSKKGIISFSFEVDYNIKMIKPLNNDAKTALEFLITPKKNVLPAKKGKIAQNPKKEVIKPPPSEDEEYVYEYVDEEEAGEEEYVMPGVPKKK